MRSILFKKYYKINDYISLKIPTIGDVLDNEDEYYDMVSILTAMPIDMMVQLDDIGIDFMSIDEYELFLLTFNSLASMNTSLIFKGLDLTKFKTAINQENGQVILLNQATGAVIDRAIYDQIATGIRKINHLKKK